MRGLRSSAACVARVAVWRGAAARTLALALALTLGLPSARGVADEISPGDAAGIASAEAAYARGSLREANRLFLAALRQPGHERGALVRIHLHLGILAGAMGAERTARSHFAIALALDPALTAPAELAGRDRSRFEQERPARGLSLSVETVSVEGTPALVVRAQNAPPRLVARIEARCGGEALATSPAGRGDPSAVRVSVASAACGGGVDLLALDAHGGVLAREHRAASGPEAP